jgi:hypothetical protein
MPERLVAGAVQSRSARFRIRGTIAPAQSLSAMTWLRRTLALTVLVAASALAVATAKAPAAAPPSSSTEVKIEAKLQQLLKPALKAAAKPQVHNLIRQIAGRQSDGDTNALWSTIIREAEANRYVQPNAPDWMELKRVLLQFQSIDSWSYEPQVYIPNYEDLPAAATVPMVVKPADESTDSVPGYGLSLSGQVIQWDDPIDEAYSDTHEVWVLSVNEGSATDPGGPTLPVPTPTADSARRDGAAKTTGPGQGPSTRDTNAVCNQTGVRNPRGLEYMLRWRVPDRRSFGGWFDGKREMRFVIIGTAGSIIKNYTFPYKVRRQTIDRWQTFPSDMFITTWDTAVIGSILAVQWYELDGGNSTNTTITVPLPGGASISTTISTGKQDDDGGLAVVQFSESTYLTYDTGQVQFQMCTQGGDGGTGNPNIACGALAVASTTAGGGYSASRATDCIESTREGGDYSWMNDGINDPSVNPEWLQVDLGVNRTFQRVVIFSTDGLPPLDFDVQAWNGTTFVNVASLRGNTLNVIVLPLAAPVTTRLVRIYGYSGPQVQPRFIRINEVELFA